MALHTSSCKITQLAATFAKKLCREQVNKKLQKIKGIFGYK